MNTTIFNNDVPCVKRRYLPCKKAVLFNFTNAVSAEQFRTYERGQVYINYINVIEEKTARLMGACFQESERG